MASAAAAWPAERSGAGMRAVGAATVPDPTVDYDYGLAEPFHPRHRGAYGATATTQPIRGLMPEQLYHIEDEPQGWAFSGGIDRLEARRATSRRSAGGGFLLPYRRPAARAARRRSAETQRDTGSFVGSLRPPRPGSAASRTVSANRGQAEERGPRLSGEESYWHMSQRRPRSGQERSRASRGLSRSAVGDELSVGLPAPEPQPSLVRSHGSPSGLRLRSKSRTALPAQRSWEEVRYSASSDTAGLLPTPVNVTRSSYSLTDEEASVERPPPGAPVSWGRLMRGWHSMCDVGPALRVGEKSLVPAARTPALALSRRVLQEDAVGSGATFALAAAERRLALARALTASPLRFEPERTSLVLLLGRRIAVSVARLMLQRARAPPQPRRRRAKQPPPILKPPSLAEGAKAVAALTDAERLQMLDEGSGSRGPSLRVAHISSALIVLLTIAKHGAGPKADAALATYDDWGHVRHLLSPQGRGAIGDPWQAAAQLIRRLGARDGNVTRLMRPLPPGRRGGLGCLQRSVVACLCVASALPFFSILRGFC